MVGGWGLRANAGRTDSGRMPDGCRAGGGMMAGHEASLACHPNIPQVDAVRLHGVEMVTALHKEIVCVRNVLKVSGDHEQSGCLWVGSLHHRPTTVGPEPPTVLRPPPHTHRRMCLTSPFIPDRHALACNHLRIRPKEEQGTIDHRSRTLTLKIGGFFFFSDRFLTKPSPM